MSLPQPAASARRLRCEAPAKLNLGLRVLGRRPDGYHELESVFVPLDLADQVDVEVSPATELEVEIEVDGVDIEVPVDERNLAWRAARGFAQAAGLDCHVRLRLVKQIPAGAGLGGGSSDAGAVLRALCELFPEALDPASLAQLALDLGADVPFFLDPRPALVGGVGEQIQPLVGAPRLFILLVNPGMPLATAEVFRALDALNSALTTAQREPTTPPSQGSRDRRWPFAGASDLPLENDLEVSAVRLCPPIARLRDRVRATGARAVGMSGSGPTVFGVFDSESAARAALERAAFEAPIWARVASTIESR